MIAAIAPEQRRWLKRIALELDPPTDIPARAGKNFSCSPAATQ